MPLTICRIITLVALTGLLWGSGSNAAHGQLQSLGGKSDSSRQIPANLKTLKRVVRVGASIENGAKTIKDIVLTLPVPTEWPEQHVTMFEETIPDEVLKSDYKQSETVRRLIAGIPQLKPRQRIELQVMFEVSVTEVPFPDRTDHLVKPGKTTRDISIHLKPSQKIESRKATVGKQAKSVVEGHELAWDQAQAIYDWVTTNIEIDKSMKEVGAQAAIKNKKGAREDASFVFIAMCRSQDIPARMVWAFQGEYAEFYLQDDTGVGRWYPAVLEGKPEFGQMTDPRVIFQKGDNIKVPEDTKRKLYVVEDFRSKGSPKSVRYMQDVLPARDAR